MSHRTHFCLYLTYIRLDCVGGVRKDESGVCTWCCINLHMLQPMAM